MYDCKVMVATVVPWVLVRTKPGSKLGSTAVCPGSGDAPAGTMWQLTIAMPSHMAGPTWDLLQDIAVLRLCCRRRESAAVALLLYPGC